MNKNSDGKNRYLYPDRQESITLVLIGETESYSNYWQKSEDKIIENIVYIINKFQLNGSLLDVGCGMGRLTKRFQKYFKKICAVEPDYERYKSCIKNINEWKLGGKVEVLNCGVEELDYYDHFDVILCSHVIQHIPEQLTEKLLSSYYRMLKNNGSLFITTTHSRSLKIEYYKSYVKGSNLFENEINQDEFNKLENVVGVLPIKFFTFQHIDNMLKNSGFACINQRVYHNNFSNRILDSIFGIDAIININQNIRNLKGRDLFIHARKETR